MDASKIEFTARISGIVLTPGDDEYEESLKRWASNSEKRAAYVVMVANADDISKAIKWSTDNRLDLAVKGGGHSASGASSSEGVIIDLSRLRTVTVDAEKRLAYAQGGALWSDFNEATMGHRLVSPGGVISNTGIGGLILGGGQGYLTGLHGLCIDNLERVTMVVANGDIVKASEKENSDLFWAIRGGGSNFGVIYEFVLRLHRHSGYCFGGFMTYSPDKIPDIVKAYRNLSPFRPDMSIRIAVGCPQDTPVVIIAPYLNTSHLEEAKTYFHEFYEIGPLTDVTSIRSYLVQNSYMDSSVPHGPRTYMTDFAYQIPSVDLLTFTADKVTEYRAKIGEDYRPCAIFYETYPFDQVTKIPADSSAYANRGRHFNCTVQLRWAGSQHDEWVKAWIKDFVRQAREIDKRVMLAEGRDPTPERGYATFHLPGDRAEKAFGGNLERLKEVKRKWDPNGIFNKWLNIPI